MYSVNPITLCKQGFIMHEEFKTWFIEKSGLTIKQLAEKLGVGVNMTYKLLAGTKPSLDTAQKIYEISGINWLAKESDDKAAL